jgi:murein DD-endopeptidase MepM/ murein hydrolase activator NlpD
MMNEGYCGGNDIWGTCATYNTQSGVMGTGHMQHPINGAIITQVFAHPEYQLWCGCWKPHTGIDLAAPYGSPIMAADSGQVIWTGWDWSGLGWAVKINHGNYIATIYGHMERFIVKVGQNVTKGQVIGYEGSTGASTGPHVHFMVLVNNIWVNPTLYVQLP